MLPCESLPFYIVTTTNMPEVQNLSGILKLLGILLSRPLLTLRLANPRRIKNAIRFLLFNRGNRGQLYDRYVQIYGMSDSAVEIREPLGASREKEYKGTIMIFPIIDWEYRYARPQHLATNLAKLGYRVFYFSTCQLLDVGKEPYRITRHPCENVYVCRLRGAGENIEDLLREKMCLRAVDAYATSLSHFLKDLCIESPVVILHHPYWLPLARTIQGGRIGYDCMDFHQGFLGETEMDESERLLLRTADFVVASSSYLHQKIGAMRRDVPLIRNGCDHGVFSTIGPQPKTQVPVAGYVGAVEEWFDIDLVVGVARKLPGWRFVIIGSTLGCNIHSARRMRNIEFVGEVSYEEVPAQLAGFDVCMIPFRITELIKATNPVKVYEYLAAGRPVVATPIPELMDFGDKVAIASTADEFAAKLQEGLHVSQELLGKWRHWTAAQDWSVRAREFEKVMKDGI
jgi:glycosyltransferase involved in cell wall biosynthesis